MHWAALRGRTGAMNITGWPWTCLHVPSRSRIRWCFWLRECLGRRGLCAAVSWRESGSSEDLTCSVCGRRLCPSLPGPARHPPTPHRRKEHTMRMMLHVTLPHEPFNAAVKDGSVGAKMKRILEQLKPEGTYFTDNRGHC